MRHINVVLATTFILISSGCATMPSGPSVLTFPTPGKPYDLFLVEDSYCRQAAERQTGMLPQEVADQNTAMGAFIGAAAGTGIGAALGAASGNVGAGAVIGGLSGLMIGSAAGSDSGRIEGREAQRRYDTVYLQCMYAHGNQPYNPNRSYYRRRTVAFPPPPPRYDRVPPDYIPLYPPRNTPPP